MLRAQTTIYMKQDHQWLYDKNRREKKGVKILHEHYKTIDAPSYWLDYPTVAFLLRLSLAASKLFPQGFS